MLAAIFGVAYHYVIQKPVYKSVGSVILIAQSSQTSETSEVTEANFNYSLSLIPFLVDLMNDAPVMKSVKSDLEASDIENKDKYTLDNLGDLVSTSARTYSSLEKSLYIDVTASTSDAELSPFLVTSVINNSISIANDDSSPYSTILKNSIVKAAVASDPVDSSMSLVKTIIISILTGFILGALYGVAYEMMNTKVTSPNELEAMTGIKVLAGIPSIEEIADEEKRPHKQRKSRKTKPTEDSQEDTE